MQCRNCKADISFGTIKCPACGETVCIQHEELTTKEIAELKICPECSSELTDSTGKCKVCGYDLNKVSKQNEKYEAIEDVVEDFIYKTKRIKKLIELGFLVFVIVIILLTFMF